MKDLLATGSTDLTLLIALVTAFGLLALILLGVGIALFIFFKRRPYHFDAIKLEEPDYLHYAFAEESTILYDISKKKATALQALENVTSLSLFVN